MVVGGVSLWRGVSPPPPWLLASRITQTFLSTNLDSLLAFERWAARSHLWLRGQKRIFLWALRIPRLCPGNGQVWACVRRHVRLREVFLKISVGFSCKQLEYLVSVIWVSGGFWVHLQPPSTAARQRGSLRAHQKPQNQAVPALPPSLARFLYGIPGVVI